LIDGGAHGLHALERLSAFGAEAHKDHALEASIKRLAVDGSI
jgi:hypothetical protein